MIQFNMLNGISEFNINSAGGSQQPTAQCHSLIDISECLDSISHLPIQQEAQSDKSEIPRGPYCPSCLLMGHKFQLILEARRVLAGAI